ALVPMFKGAPSLSDALRAGATNTTGGRRDGRLRDVLVITQVVVAFVLLIGAGLMTRSLVKLQQVDGGYVTRGILTGRIDLDWVRYTNRNLVSQFAEALKARMVGQPGVMSVGLSSDFPLNNGQPSKQPFLIRGVEPSENDGGPQSDVTIVDADYFRTMGVSLVRGRAFSDADRDTLAYPVIVSQRLASRYWKDAEPLGREVSIDRGRSWHPIVGVVGDVKQNGLQYDFSDEIYLPFSAQPAGDIRVLVRTTVDPQTLAATLRTAVREIDDKQPLSEVQTLERLRGLSLSEPRVTTALMMAFAILAMVITAGGLTGVVSYSVNQRINEIGIRVALGARPASIVSLVLKEGITVVAIGLLIGVAGALASARLLSRLLYAVAPTDPTTFAAVALGLLAVAALASYLPARRALRVDPVEALRKV
ncbi:MAG TPA: FtsX-like permease family protein, partial [Gemmatimonadaceae bacterium]|nr:FtsX-like permease family protein [Gemmatimonadaceae bacterium]